ncbi:MAG: hypothetical protein KKF41_03665 [Actinobacteria bacterium]|nr:hypothetical protein [Actinomycetota bacterium]MBU1945001.1 hypothetical protein [Actinomycetota bacterium]MBU2686663.1 hypothetical protein [Actinomycetota bacterium]
MEFRMQRRCSLLPAVVVLTSLVMVLAGCGNSGTAYKVINEEGQTETVDVREIGAQDLGVPVYPGAVLQNKGALVENTDKQGKEVTRMAVLETKDPVKKVVDWYRANLSTMPEFSDASTTVKDKEIGLITYKSGKETKCLTIADDHGTTEIAVTSSTEAP